MEGVDVYNRDEIPNEFHYKNNRLAPEILLVAKPGYHIQGLPQTTYGTDPNRNTYLKQIPPGDRIIPRRSGNHGYANRKEMRGIFFAKGPGKEAQLNTQAQFKLLIYCHYF